MRPRGTTVHIFTSASPWQRLNVRGGRAGGSSVRTKQIDTEAYAKVSLKKYKPMAARNEDRNVSSGLL